MSYHYLASPYSTPDLALRTWRVQETFSALAWLLARRIWTYSPIVHCDELSRIYALPTDARYWKDLNEAMIVPTAGIIVLGLPGWTESTGVARELKFAGELGLPIDWLSRGKDGEWTRSADLSTTSL